MRNYKRGELTKDILLAFVAGGAAIGMVFIFSALPGLAHIFKLIGRWSLGFGVFP